MVFYPVPTDRDFDIVIPLFSAFSVITTVFRVWDRARKRLFGADDACAVVALGFHIIFLTTFFLFIQFPGQPTDEEGVITYYLLASAFPGVLWMARISIVFSVMRIVPYSHQRRWLGALVILFLIFWSVLLAQPFWICETDTTWKTPATGRPQCALGIQRGACELTFDIIGDVAILLPPLTFLWRLKLQQSLRLRLIFLFSTSVFITVVSIVHDVIVLQVGNLPELFAALLQDSIALIVCNMTVVVTGLYNIFGQKNGDNSTDVALPPSAERRSAGHKSRSRGTKSFQFWKSGATTTGLVTRDGQGNELVTNWVDDPRSGDSDSVFHIEDGIALDDLTKRGAHHSEASSIYKSVRDEDDQKSTPFSGFGWPTQDFSDKSDRHCHRSDGIFVEREVHIDRIDSALP